MVARRDTLRGMASETGWAEWGNLVAYLLLLVVVLLAPFAPFAFFAWAYRFRPDWVAAYWQNPVGNAILLALALSALRVAFLAALFALATVFSVFIYVASAAWYPELLARLFLAERGLPVDPSPDGSLLAEVAILFGLNLVWWLAFLLVAAGWKLLRRCL
jgi:hypothetical protein